MEPHFPFLSGGEWKVQFTLINWITQKCLKRVKWQKQKVIARYLSHAWSAHQKLLSFLTTDITCLLWSKLFFLFSFLVSLIIMCLDTLKGIGDQRGCVNLLISACYQTLKSCCLLLTSNSLQYRKEKTKFIWKFFSLFKVIIGRLAFFFLENFFLTYLSSSSYLSAKIIFFKPEKDSNMKIYIYGTVYKLVISELYKIY